MANNSAINLYYQNVRGMRTKTNTLYRNQMHVNFDIICLSETWLLPGIYDAELFDSRYNVYRCDRDYDARGDTRGGGVLIAVNCSLSVSSVTNIPMPGTAGDVLEVSIPLGALPTSKVLRVYCCYFPQCNEQYNAEVEFYDIISQKIIDFPHDQFLITGDFNVRYACWTITNNTATINNKYDNDQLLQALSGFIDFTALNQFNTIPNSKGRHLDLILGSCECVVTSCIEPLLPLDALYHPALNVTVRLNRPRPLPPSARSVRSFRTADYEVINATINELDWYDLLDCTDINKAVTVFYDTINEIINKHVPCKIVKEDTRHPPWFSKSLKKLIKEKLKFHKKYKIYGRQSDYDTFHMLRERQKRIQVECYDNFIRKSEDRIEFNSKNFWSFVKSKRNVSRDLPPTMYLDSESASDVQKIGSLFNSYFQSVFEPEDNTRHNNNHTATAGSSTAVSIGTTSVTLPQVQKYLKTLDINKGCGPDGIPPLFLRNCRCSICEPLFILFNLSLNSGRIPAVWKRSYVVPIFKSGDIRYIKDYRPISKLSTIPKLFEKIIYDSIFPLLLPTIIAQQHGFVNKKSTETQLCEFVHIIATAMSQGSQVDVVYTDYSKAFDKISHNILIHKLERVGICGDLLRWLISYLRDRTQAVTIKGHCTSFIPVTSGVPQGSHLGPLMFNIFVNDVVEIFKNSNFLLYADDKKILRLISEPSDSLALQEDLNNLNVYCSNNSLFINAKKCNVITFTRKSNPITSNYFIGTNQIERVNEVRDLGVLLDSELTFKSHINRCTTKAYKMLGFIMRIGSASQP